MLLTAACVGWVVSLTGCGGEDAGRDFPTGQWTASRSGSTAVVDFRPHGKWTFSFGESTDGLTLGSEGRYSTTDETIRFEADSYCKSQDPATEQGTYVWEMEGGNLTFVPQDDRCLGRKGAFVGVVFGPYNP
jgi:hypothetical protein